MYLSKLVKDTKIATKRWISSTQKRLHERGDDFAVGRNARFLGARQQTHNRCHNCNDSHKTKASDEKGL